MADSCETSGLLHDPPVSDGMLIASPKNPIYDRLHLPPDAQSLTTNSTKSLTTNSTTRFLIDHVTVQQCGIIGDSTVQVLTRGRGGMIDSFQGSISLPHPQGGRVVMCTPD